MKLKTKLFTLTTALCLIGVSAISISALAGKDIISLKFQAKALDSQFEAENNTMLTMPDQTKDEQDARIQQGLKAKNISAESRELKLQADPDDSENFPKQLDESIGNLYICFNELKERAARENDDKYLKQAQELQKRIEKLKNGKESYSKNEKSVNQLRKELDLPVL